MSFTGIRLAGSSLEQSGFTPHSTVNLASALPNDVPGRMTRPSAYIPVHKRRSLVHTLHADEYDSEIISHMSGAKVGTRVVKRETSRAQLRPWAGLLPVPSLPLADVALLVRRAAWGTDADTRQFQRHIALSIARPALHLLHINLLPPFNLASASQPSTRTFRYPSSGRKPHLPPVAVPHVPQRQLHGRC